MSENLLLRRRALESNLNKALSEDGKYCYALRADSNTNTAPVSLYMSDDWGQTWTLKKQLRATGKSAPQANTYAVGMVLFSPTIDTVYQDGTLIFSYPTTASELITGTTRDSNRGRILTYDPSTDTLTTGSLATPVQYNSSNYINGNTVGKLDIFVGSRDKTAGFSILPSASVGSATAISRGTVSTGNKVLTVASLYSSSVFNHNYATSIFRLTASVSPTSLAMSADGQYVAYGCVSGSTTNAFDIVFWTSGSGWQSYRNTETGSKAKVISQGCMSYTGEYYYTVSGYASDGDILYSNYFGSQEYRTPDGYAWTGCCMTDDASIIFKSCSCSAKFAVSKDLGITWTIKNTPGNFRFIKCNSKGSVILAHDSARGTGSLWRSTDQGDTWTKVFNKYIYSTGFAISRLD